MPFYEKGNTRIHYEDVGSGYPLLIIPGGGLNSKIDFYTLTAPFHASRELQSEYRCITPDLRNAPEGQSSGPLEVDRPWDSHTDDQLGLMEHLGFKKFLVMGFCIGGPFIWNLLKRAPERIVAAVISQPSGVRPEAPRMSYDNNLKGWGPQICAMRPDLNMEMVEKYLRNMYLDKDFVYTVSRDFVKGCKTNVLVMPDDVPAHPYVVAMESARLAPNAEVCLYPWKDSKENIALALRHVRTFLKANRPAA
jgi:pimeloyl-ACP methyl ester carboxylesterase